MFSKVVLAALVAVGCLALPMPGLYPQHAPSFKSQVNLGVKKSAPTITQYHCADPWCLVNCTQETFAQDQCFQSIQEELQCSATKDTCADILHYNGTGCTMPWMVQTIVCGMCYNVSGNFGMLTQCGDYYGSTYAYDCDPTCTTCKSELQLNMFSCAFGPLSGRWAEMIARRPCNQLIDIKMYSDSQCQNKVSDNQIAADSCYTTPKRDSYRLHCNGDGM